MKKSILNIGKELNRNEQKQVQGGLGFGNGECTNPSYEKCYFQSPLGNDCSSPNEICVFAMIGEYPLAHGTCQCPPE